MKSGNFKALTAACLLVVTGAVAWKTLSPRYREWSAEREARREYEVYATALRARVDALDKKLSKEGK